MASFSGVTFVLFCFVFVFKISLKPRPFVQSSFDMQAGHPIATRVSLFFIFVYLGMSLFFRFFFGTIAVFSLYGEYNTSYVLISFRMVFFDLVTAGWIFCISLLLRSICESSIDQFRKKIGLATDTFNMHTSYQLID